MRSEFVFVTCLCFKGRRTLIFYRIRTNSHTKHMDNYTWNTKFKALLCIILMSINECIYRIYNINNLYWRKYVQPVQVVHEFASRDKAVGSDVWITFSDSFHLNKLVEDNIEVMLHAKSQSSEPYSFREE